MRYDNRFIQIYDTIRYMDFNRVAQWRKNCYNAYTYTRKAVKIDLRKTCDQLLWFQDLFTKATDSAVHRSTKGRCPGAGSLSYGPLSGGDGPGTLVRGGGDCPDTIWPVPSLATKRFKVGNDIPSGDLTWQQIVNCHLLGLLNHVIQTKIIEYSQDGESSSFLPAVGCIFRAVSCCRRCVHRFWCQLEQVAITDVLPLKAARGDSIATQNLFGPLNANDATGQIPFLAPN